MIKKCIVVFHNIIDLLYLCSIKCSLVEHKKLEKHEEQAKHILIEWHLGTQVSFLHTSKKPLYYTYIIRFCWLDSADICCSFYAES